MSKITHEQAKETIQEIQDSFTHNAYYERYEFDAIKDYISQQEQEDQSSVLMHEQHAKNNDILLNLINKQEKLLELYKEYYTITNSVFQTDCETTKNKSERKREIRKQIKELENDLK